MTGKKNSVYEQAIQQFTFEGDKKDVSQLQELIEMIAYTPAGQRVLQDALDRKTPLAISFCEGFKDKDTKGMFLWREQAIKLVRFDTNLPRKTGKDLIEVKIKMANIMAHELQHYVDFPRNVWLNRSVHVANEGLLALALCEMSAFSTGDSVECALRTERGMPVRWMPKTPDEWKKVMTSVLLGQNKTIKDYMNKCRKNAKEHGASFEQKLPSKEFYQGVTDFLKKMNIDMSCMEAMLRVGQSQQLLPMKTSSKTRSDR